MIIIKIAKELSLMYRSVLLFDEFKIFFVVQIIYISVNGTTTVFNDAIIVHSIQSKYSDTTEIIDPPDVYGLRRS